MVRQLVVEDLDTIEILEFILFGSNTMNKKYGGIYDWSRFPITKAVRERRVMMCFRKNKPVGFMVSTLSGHLFDPTIILLKQNVLFALPNTRAAFHLVEDFIDFGKANANHIIASIGTETNIKSKSLEKLGFKKLEEHYRMENV